MHTNTHQLAPDGPPLKPAELARALGCSRAVVDAAIKSGALSAFRLGRRYFIPRPVALEMLTTGRIPVGKVA